MTTVDSILRNVKTEAKEEPKSLSTSSKTGFVALEVIALAAFVVGLLGLGMRGGKISQLFGRTGCIATASAGGVAAAGSVIAMMALAVQHRRLQKTLDKIVWRDSTDFKYKESDTLEENQYRVENTDLQYRLLFQKDKKLYEVPIATEHSNFGITLYAKKGPEIAFMDNEFKEITVLKGNSQGEMTPIDAAFEKLTAALDSYEEIQGFYTIDKDNITLKSSGLKITVHTTEVLPGYFCETQAVMDSEKRVNQHALALAFNKVMIEQKASDEKAAARLLQEHSNAYAIVNQDGSENFYLVSHADNRFNVVSYNEGEPYDIFDLEREGAKQFTTVDLADESMELIENDTNMNANGSTSPVSSTEYSEPGELDQDNDANTNAGGSISAVSSTEYDGPNKVEMVKNVLDITEPRAVEWMEEVLDDKAVTASTTRKTKMDASSKSTISALLEKPVLEFHNQASLPRAAARMRAKGKDGQNYVIQFSLKDVSGKRFAVIHGGQLYIEKDVGACASVPLKVTTSNPQNIAAQIAANPENFGFEHVGEASTTPNPYATPQMAIKYLHNNSFAEFQNCVVVKGIGQHSTVAIVKSSQAQAGQIYKEKGELYFKMEGNVAKKLSGVQQDSTEQAIDIILKQVKATEEAEV